ncbi:hypothetical protein AGR5A_Lc10079 [Agrobacterium genomosp. 5 str. CFBP 6626]|nr:hypothetical protein AGR5A_Lc10079 [Agrobacterium genomosp. 5 str. CFBP 6626]
MCLGPLRQVRRQTAGVAKPDETASFGKAASSAARHPGLDPGSSAIKSLIARESFHGADAPWLDAGSSPA